MSQEAKKTLSEIQKYWSEAAKLSTDTQNLRPTARDPYLQVVVEASIERWLHAGAALLDIGCGDGLSTLRFSERVSRAVGVDFINEYVAKAKANAMASRASNVEFEIGNILDLTDLRKRHGSSDIVTTIRCIINLPSWADQAHAIGEVAACVRSGGLYLASEGWEEGMIGLNLHRQRAGLEPIRVVEYNRMMPRARFEEECRKYFDVIGYISAGYYLYMSRVFQPCFVAPGAAQHSHPINKIAADLQIKCVVGEEFPDCDYAGVYILRRRI
jgi:SAM-dependent methyltransferase